MDGSHPLVTPDGDPPFEDEPAAAPRDGQRPALTAVPSAPEPAAGGEAEPPDGGPQPPGREAEPPDGAAEPPGREAEPRPPSTDTPPGAGVSATFREIERRASAEIHRIAAESRREIAALRAEFASPVDAGPGADRHGVRGWFRRRGGKAPEAAAADGSITARAAPPDRRAPRARIEDTMIWDRWPTPSSARPRTTTLVVVAVTVVLLCVGAAYVVGVRLQPTLYGAQATFLLTPQPELSDTAVDHQTETQLLVVTSSQVLQPVASHSGVPLDTLQKEVSADMNGRSYVLVITVADGDRQRAVSLADGVARQYAAVAPTLTGASAQARPIDVKLLTSAAGIEEPLQPRPLRIVAAGLLVGILAALVVVVLLVRPWRSGRRQPYWT